MNQHQKKPAPFYESGTKLTHIFSVFSVSKQEEKESAYQDYFCE